MCLACLNRRAVILGLLAGPALTSVALAAPGPHLAPPSTERTPETLRHRALRQGLPADLIEPRMHLEGTGGAAPRVALTFDACDGHTDMRILDMLIRNEIPATIFATGLWLRRNPAQMKLMLAHPDLFALEDHGARHHAAIDRPLVLWHVPSVGSAEGLREEVEGGARDLVAAGAPPPRWFRGATALYTASAMRDLRGLGYRIAGFSINGDEGASLGAAEVRRRYAMARDGDVLISHINQPLRPAGGGVVDGVMALKARGMRFVRLSDPEVRVSEAV